MKGTDELKSKLPDYQGRKILVFLLLGFIVLAASLMFQVVLDSLPRIFISIEILQVIAPLTPIIGPLFIISIGFLVVRKFWRIRDKYLAKYRTKGYQKAFKLIAIGIPMLFSVIIHSFFATDFLIPYGYDDTMGRYLESSLSELILGFSHYFLYIRLAMSIILVGLGLFVINRTLKFFGIDYMALVYLFYPEESKLKNHEIYSILRHPTYHSLLLISIGGVFFRFSIYSVIYFLFLLIGLNIHLKYVEEKELIQRFGESYKKYKEDVPAFFVKFRDLRKYFITLFKT